MTEGILIVAQQEVVCAFLLPGADGSQKNGNPELLYVV